MPQRLRRPAQRRHRITTFVRLNQRHQGRDELRVMLGERLASSAGKPRPTDRSGSAAESSSSAPRRTVVGLAAAATAATPPCPSSRAAHPSASRRVQAPPLILSCRPTDAASGGTTAGGTLPHVHQCGEWWSRQSTCGAGSHVCAEGHARVTGVEMVVPRRPGVGRRMHLRMPAPSRTSCLPRCTGHHECRHTSTSRSPCAGASGRAVRDTVGWRPTMKGECAGTLGAEVVHQKSGLILLGLVATGGTAVGDQRSTRREPLRLFGGGPGDGRRIVNAVGLSRPIAEE
jgi:hypothetical protein